MGAWGGDRTAGQSCRAREKKSEASAGAFMMTLGLWPPHIADRLARAVAGHRSAAPLPDHRDPLCRRRRRDRLQTRFWKRARPEGVLRLHHAPDLRPQAAPGARDRGLPEAPYQADPSRGRAGRVDAVPLKAAGPAPWFSLAW